MSDYTVWSRLLHRLALGLPSVSEATFDLERNALANKLGDASSGEHVFVAGLARSGTTMLMRSLYETGLFCSLTYRDMPFVLAPNTWGSLAQRGKQDMTMAERAHADGVLVDFDSPEALEEVFWRVFCGDRYIRPDKLTAMRVDADTKARFQTYVAMVLHRYGSERYLSKNNNNVLRLGDILSSFPHAKVLVPFRRPEQQALSLLLQHKRFLEMHQRDRFSEAYMRWLVHHEFGLDHRPFEWGRELSDGLSPTTLDYWLAQWLGVYGQLSKFVSENPAQTIPVSYETVCNQTTVSWQSLNHLLRLGDAPEPNIALRTQQITESIDPNLLARATDVYESLSAQCDAQLLHERLLD